MKLLLTCLAFALLSPSSVADVAISVEKVESAEAVCFMDEWYVALVTEPIYLRSEGKSLCNTVRKRIRDAFGVDSYVTIDVGLYYDIQEAKESSEKYNKLLKISEIFKNRCENEYHFHNQSQKAGTCPY